MRHFISVNKIHDVSPELSKCTQSDYVFAEFSLKQFLLRKKQSCRLPTVIFASHCLCRHQMSTNSMRGSHLIGKLTELAI